MVDEGLAQPILVGRPAVVEEQIKRLGLRINKNEHFELIAPEENPHYEEFWQHHYKRKSNRNGVTIELARRDVRRKNVINRLAIGRAWTR